MSVPREYSYSDSTKSSASDELLNTYVVRPVAGRLVRLLYRAPVTPNQVTLAATGAGLASAICYARGTPGFTAAAGLLLVCKDILDSADGQLARAKQLYSRAGRFLDSLGDILVNACVFAAVAAALQGAGRGVEAYIMAAAAFLCLTLRVSYHVFYQTSYLHIRQAYAINRTTEEIRDEDRSAGRPALLLQRVFQVVYGWQDRLMVRLDRWSREGKAMSDEAWYGDRTALRWSGFIGLGTELWILMLFSLGNALPAYLAANLAGMNAVWAGCILYRKLLGRKTLR